ncbi:MAG: hypothetical protein IT381_30865 [Deltaproteobacteria bacterium]|nr:hypothetical protein [Deltaproteobacteria bacterium]
MRDSSLYVTKAQGSGGSFLRYDDPAPKGTELTAVDGFEITGYSQAVVRDCCGGGFLGDSTNTSVIAVSNNLVEENAGDEPQASHGGAFYFFGHTLTITGNTFIKNTVTGWGAGLYLGAYSPGGQETSATLTWNVYRDNRADNTGGGMFCDDSAHCTSDHEIYDRNCGGNIYLDSGPDDAAPTVASFDHVTNYGALDATCAAPGPGVVIDEGNAAQDVYTFKNAIFWGNAAGRDFSTSCVAYCNTVNASITSSSVQQSYHNDGVNVTFGAGVVEASDPRFVDAAAHDFRLQAKDGVWAKLGAYGE